MFYSNGHRYKYIIFFNSFFSIINVISIYMQSFLAYLYIVTAN